MLLGWYCSFLRCGDCVVLRLLFRFGFAVDVGCLGLCVLGFLAGGLDLLVSGGELVLPDFA